MRVVRFNAEQRELAISTGRRRFDAPELCRRDRHGAVRCAAIDILGAAGELAVSLAYGLAWETRLLSSDYRRPDFAPDIQVRTAAGVNKRLLVHPDDADEQRFVFVLLIEGVFGIYEWLWGWECKHPPFWRDPTRLRRPAYFVPTTYIVRGWPARQILP